MRFMALSAFGLVLALAKPAIAQKAEAAAAFERGKDLIAKGQIAEGCAELETSMRLEPLMGTLYNLALCHEQLGKIASAWTEFKEVAGSDKNAARGKDSTRRAAALEKKLTRMRIVVTTPVEGLVVKRDDVDVTALVGKNVPVDPARYTFVASAPGHADASVEIDLSAPSKTIDVTIPTLAAAEDTKPTPSASGIATDPYADRITLRPLVLPRGVLEATARVTWASSPRFYQDAFDTLVRARRGFGRIEVRAAAEFHTRYAEQNYRPVLTKSVAAGADYIISPLFSAGLELRKYHPFGGDIQQGIDFRADVAGKRIFSPAVAIAGRTGIFYLSRQTRGQDRASTEFGFLGDGVAQLSPISRVSLEAIARVRLNISGDRYGELVHIEVGAGATFAVNRRLDAYIQTSLYALPRSDEFDTRLVLVGVNYRHP